MTGLSRWRGLGDELVAVGMVWSGDDWVTSLPLWDELEGAEFELLIKDLRVTRRWGAWLLRAALTERHRERDRPVCRPGI
jgi:hypothetical protein